MPILAHDPHPRHLRPAVFKGMRCKCPSCGKGKLYRAYLKTRDECAVCGEEFFHHRADDLPPYLALVIVGHVLVAAMVELEMGLHVNATQYLIYLIPLAIILPLVMLPAIKGGVVGLQWALKMHGFADTPAKALDNDASRAEPAAVSPLGQGLPGPH